MTQGSSQNVLYDTLSSKEKRSIELKQILDQLKPMAIDLARSGQTATIRQQGVAMIEAITFTRVAIEQGDAALAALSAMDIKDWARYIDLSESQSRSGRAGAEAKWSRDETRSLFREFIYKLARERDELGFVDPSDLWPKLIGMMDEAGMEPDETGPGNLEGAYIESPYLAKPYTYDAFARRIRRMRESA